MFLATRLFLRSWTDGRTSLSFSRSFSPSRSLSLSHSLALSCPFARSLIRSLACSLVHDAETINSISNRSDLGRAPVNLSLSFSSPLTPTAVAAADAAAVALFSPLLPSIWLTIINHQHRSPAICLCFSFRDLDTYTYVMWQRGGKRERER